MRSNMGARLSKGSMGMKEAVRIWFCTATRAAIPSKAQGVSEARSLPLLCDSFLGGIAHVKFHQTVKNVSDQSEDSRLCIFSLVWPPFIFYSSYSFVDAVCSLTQ